MASVSRRNWFLAGLGLAAVAYLAMWAIGGLAGEVAEAGIATVLLLIVALLAYAGATRIWARVFAVAWLALVTGGAALLALGFSYEALAPDPEAALPPATAGQLALIGAGLGLGLLVGWLGYLPPLRRWLARALPLDPRSFVHATALVAVVSLTLVSVVPLIVLGEPPLLAIVAQRDPGTLGGSLETDLYGLLWLVPAAFLAVGFPLVRDWPAARHRLGLVRPTLRQVGWAVPLAVALVVLVTGFEHLWDALGLPVTDAELVERLFAYAAGPLGALVIGVTAGLGEELAVRGVLQPRLGLWLSNLLFTSLHAFQYGLDGLVIVFFLGLVLGLVRRCSNTTTSAIVHGTYNFLVGIGLLGALGAPGFS